MAQFALVGPADEVKEIRGDVDPDVPTKEGWRWLKYEQERPVQGEGQVIEGPTRTVEEDRVVDTWTVRDKTTQEISAEKEETVKNLPSELLFDVLFSLSNRIRVLEGSGNQTVAQFKSSLKAMVDA